MPSIHGKSGFRAEKMIAKTHMSPRTPAKCGTVARKSGTEAGRTGRNAPEMRHRGKTRHREGKTAATPQIGRCGKEIGYGGGENRAKRRQNAAPWQNSPQRRENSRNAANRALWQGNRLRRRGEQGATPRNAASWQKLATEKGKQPRRRGNGAVAGKSAAEREEGGQTAKVAPGKRE